MRKIAIQNMKFYVVMINWLMLSILNYMMLVLLTFNVNDNIGGNA